MNNIEITEVKLLKNGFNDMEGKYWYYLYCFRLYNETHEKYCECSFVINFTGEDFDEFRYDEEADNYNAEYAPKDYADELASSFIDSYTFSYKKPNSFFEACEESIERYNARYAANYDGFSIWGMACGLTKEVFGNVLDEHIDFKVVYGGK